MTEKTPLLLLPGLLCDAALWQMQITQLADYADSVVADLSRADNMTALAQAALAQAPPRFALAGLSMGGYCALEILRLAPERVLLLALLDTSARPDTPEQSRRRRGLIALSRRGVFKGVTPKLLPLLLHPARLDDQALVATVTGMAERIGPDGFIRQQHAIMSRADSRPLLPTIGCPTLVLCGRQDALTPLALHEELAALIPGARLQVIEDCGHLATLERPMQTTAALRDWLTG